MVSKWCDWKSPIHSMSLPLPSNMEPGVRDPVPLKGTQSKPGPPDPNVSQVSAAATSALEHSLGMTCDPVLGLVQVCGFGGGEENTLPELRFGLDTFACCGLSSESRKNPHERRVFGNSVADLMPVTVVQALGLIYFVGRLF